MRARSLIPLVAAMALGAPDALGIDRVELASGDSVTGEVRVPGEIDEYVFTAPRGAGVTLTVGKSAPGKLRSNFELVDESYDRVSTFASGPSSVSLVSPLRFSGRLRMLLAGFGSQVGGYKLKLKVKPAKRFSLKATAADAEPADTLRLGALAGWTIQPTIKSKGTAAVTIATLTGPDGTELDPGEPTIKGSKVTYPALTAPEFGDYTIVLDLPEGATKWALTVKLAGSLPKGRRIDTREGPIAAPRGLAMPAANFFAFPLVRVIGERGGPNDLGLASSTAGPEPQRSVRNSACARIALESSDEPTRYRLVCSNGTVAEVEGVVRDPSGNITAYDAVSVRSSGGSGSSRLSDFTYDAQGRANGWTELRTFSTSGRTHRLVFTDVDRFDGGVLRSFGVDHTPPGGETRHYEYAPLDSPNQ